jgi:hypothetical protein
MLVQFLHIMIFLKELTIFKLIQVLFISGIKFLFAPFIAIGYGFNYFQTVLLTTIGGIVGIYIFYFLSKWMIRQYNKYCPLIFSYFTSESVEKAKIILNCEPGSQKKFSRKSRLLINFRLKYGFIGIILLTPVLLSIPIGAFLAQKYYSKRNNVLFYLSISVVVWSLFISTFFFLV